MNSNVQQGLARLGYGVYHKNPYRHLSPPFNKPLSLQTPIDEDLCGSGCFDDEGELWDFALDHCRDQPSLTGRKAELARESVGGGRITLSLSRDGTWKATLYRGKGGHAKLRGHGQSVDEAIDALWFSCINTEVVQ